jgi:hypothetical protein
LQQQQAHAEYQRQQQYGTNGQQQYVVNGSTYVNGSDGQEWAQHNPHHPQQQQWYQPQVGEQQQASNGRDGFW